MSRPVALVTIGVYGWTYDRFFGALESAQIDTFCDIRRRRGVRGPEYAYVNSTRLQAELARRGIRYHHLLSLAPTEQMRAIQAAHDTAARVARRQRSELSREFAEAYRAEILDRLDLAALLESLGPDARRITLFCVEREPAACHRSLAAERMEKEMGIPVTHLLP